MSPDTITALILHYRYWILIPLCFLEGPIVAFVAGTLASFGYFDIYVLGAVFFVRDIAMDGFMYVVGRFGGETRFGKWLLKKVGVTSEHLRGIHDLWDKYAGRTMFFSKLSYGLAATFLVVAGLVKLSPKKFFAYGALVTVLQYGVLLVLGYFFGNTFETVSNVLNNIGYVLLAVSIFVTAYYVFTHFMRRRLLKQEAKEEELDS
jgi:membrane protein DedA with SNARE-associated domain